MDARRVATADGPVRFRLTVWQQLPFYFLWALILTEEAFFTFATHIRLALPVTSVLILPLVFLTRWFGVTLTPDEAIVHNLRRRRIAWRDIQTIQAERLFGNRIVVLYEASGRRTRLRAPLSGFLNWDRRFEEKFDAIGQRWSTHRGEAQVAAGPQNSGRAGWAPPMPFSQPARIRLAAVQIALILMLLGCLLLGSFADIMFRPSGDAVTRPGALLIIVLLVIVGLIVEAMWHLAVNAGLTAKPEGLEVHNLRKRRLDWSEIASFSVKTTWHGTRLVAHEVSGRRTRLSGPRIGILLWDNDFAAKTLAVDAWWRASTGGQAAAPLDLSSMRRPAIWKKIVVGLAALAFGYELFVGSLVTLLLLVAG